MKKGNVLKLVTIMVVVELIMVVTATDSNIFEGEKISFTPCMIQCGLKCLTDSKDWPKWKWLTCLGACVAQCSNTPIDRVCATNCVGSLCSKFLDSGT